MNGKFAVIMLATAVVAVAGCFNEPVSADKTVSPDQRVYLQDRGISSWAEGVASRFKGDIGAIDYLNLDRNQLADVSGVEKLTGLKWLRLNSNRLSKLPDLKPLAELRRIYLRGNRFTAVPETLKDLPSLTDIDLSDNPLSEVPVWLAQKKGLENLSFSNTGIARLPDDISAWKSLKSLQLGGLKFSPSEMARIRKALGTDVAIVF